MHHPSGTRIGPYEIVHELGAGGMGRVYLARDGRLHRDVALKFLHPGPDPLTGPDPTPRLLHEARAASALNHPHICHVYDVGESTEGRWIAMEYVPGDPLSERIPGGGFPFDVARRIGVQLAGALAHAHARGIVHRDLKPANCVMDASGDIKILDFGLAGRTAAKLATDITRTGDPSVQGPAGTPAYMAPEVVRGERADERSDLWSLGVILHELASGARPFSGSTPYDVASAILTASPPPLPASVSTGFRAAVQRLLEKEPARRYGSAAEVHAALEALDSSTIAVAAGQPTRRYVAWPAVATAAAVLAVAAIGIYGWRSRDRPLVLTGLQIVPVGDTPVSSPALAPAGNLAAFLAPDSRGISQVWVRNLAEGVALQVTSGDEPAERPRWRADGNAIVFALRGRGIWSVSALGGAPRQIVAEGSNPNLSADGRFLTWETRRGIWVAATDGSGAREVSGVPPRFYSVARMPALSPDGNQIAFFHPEAGPLGDFWIIPSQGGQPRKLTSDFSEGSAPVWTHDGGRLIVSSMRAGSRTLWQIPVDRGTPQPLTSGAGEDDAPDLGRDGRVLFTNTRQTWTLRMADRSGAERDLLRRRDVAIFARFSPDGSRIVFFGRVGPAIAIQTIGTDGSSLRQLTGGTEVNHMPRWSHDGSAILFYQLKPLRALMRIPADGGPSVEFLPWEWETQSDAVFSPDGAWLVYGRQHRVGSKEATPEATVIRDVKSGQERDLPQPHLHHPRFSRDGTSILGSAHDGTIRICPVDGSACRTIGKSNPTATVAWSGDGQRAYFMRGAAPTAPQELWSVGIDGSGERKERDLGVFRRIDHFFDVSVRNDVLWTRWESERPEIWSGQIK